MVVPRFAQQALRDDPVTVYGDGTQTRTFTYVGDVVEAIVGLLKCPEAVGEVINIGGMEEISIKDLAVRIKTLARSKSEIKFVPYDEAYTKDFEDMQRRVPSLEKIKSLTGWEPTTNLDKIIESVIDYYTNHE
jgi:UDP-glucose 4-epimerase